MPTAEAHERCNSGPNHGPPARGQQLSVREEQREQRDQGNSAQHPDPHGDPGHRLAAPEQSAWIGEQRVDGIRLRKSREAEGHTRRRRRSTRPRCRAAARRPARRRRRIRAPRRATPGRLSQRRDQPARRDSLRRSGSGAPRRAGSPPWRVHRASRPAAQGRASSVASWPFSPRLVVPRHRCIRSRSQPRVRGSLRRRPAPGRAGRRDRDRRTGGLRRSPCSDHESGSSAGRACRCR